MSTPRSGQRLRVGVIGTSSFTQRFHLTSLRNHPDVDIVALCGRNRARAQEVASRFGVPRVYTDYRELVASPEVDAVLVVTPNNLHYPQTIAALEAGKHVFCEKPLGMNVAEAQEMYQRAKAAGVVHMVHFTFRGVPAVTYMKQLIDEGYVGEVRHVAISYLGNYHYGKEELVWRRDKKQAGSGVLADLGSHMIDLARWLAGEIAHVRCQLATFVPRLKDPETGEWVPNQTDDTAALSVRFEKGAVGVLHASWVAHPGLGGMQVRAEVHGSQGVLRVDTNRTLDPRSWVTVRGAQGDQTRDQVLPLPAVLTQGLDLTDEASLLATMLRKPWYSTQRFVEAVLGRREMSPSFYDGLKVQEVMDKALADAAGHTGEG